jgi:hypothetical protein
MPGHLVATLAYRAARVLRDAPASRPFSFAHRATAKRGVLRIRAI